MKTLRILVIRLGIIGSLFNRLWSDKLWWIMPIVFVILLLMIFLLIMGHTGFAAIIYPLF